MKNNLIMTGQSDDRGRCDRCGGLPRPIRLEETRIYVARDESVDPAMAWVTPIGANTTHVVVGKLEPPSAAPERSGARIQFTRKAGRRRERVWVPAWVLQPEPCTEPDDIRFWRNRRGQIRCRTQAVDLHEAHGVIICRFTVPTVRPGAGAVEVELGERPWPVLAEADL